MANVLIVYHSVGGTTRKLAHLIAEGARNEGALVRLCVPSAGNGAEAGEPVRVVTQDDFVWADAVALGSPSRFGNVSAELKSVIDGCGQAWRDGLLADKIYTAFATSGSVYGGAQQVIQSIYNSVCHFGGIIVPPGYASPDAMAAGGNPYGVAFHTRESADPAVPVASVARHQGARIARFARILSGGALEHPAQPEARIREAG